MALYQGEDIQLSFSGKGELDFSTLSSIEAYVYSKANPNNGKLYGYNNFKEINDTYTLIIPVSDTKDMRGYYTLELRLRDNSTPAITTIYIKEDAFCVEPSKIKDK